MNDLLNGRIDLTDEAFSPSETSALCSSSRFYCAAPVSEHGYFEVEFNLANNFWGCGFDFGNSACGVNIRQGIAHLFDRLIFTHTNLNIAGASTAISDPVPLNNGGLLSTNPCGWDPLFPENGSNCVVGSPGGSAYRLAAATGVNYPWQQAMGSQDFCAAAGHFKAAGLATGENAATCVLTGLAQAALTGNPVKFVIKSDSPARLELGTGISQEICALFTGNFTLVSSTVGCYFPGTTLPILTLAEVTGYLPCIFSPPPNGLNNSCWSMYTAGFGAEYLFDTSLYFGYNSLFVSGGSFDNPPCKSTTPYSHPSNYMYLCVSSYDSSSSQMDLAPAISQASPDCGNPGGQDPSLGQTTPTLGTCSGNLDSVSTGYQAEDIFGRGAYTIPVWVDVDQFAYGSGWSRVIDSQTGGLPSFVSYGAGVGIPNMFTWLDTYSGSPAVPGTIRQGFYQGIYSLSPYVYSNTQALYILGSIYDSLYRENPVRPGQFLNWMTVNSRVLNNTQLGYSPPAGTVETIRNTLRTDLFWHDGMTVTPWDVKFSLLTLKNSGSVQGSLLGGVSSVTVLGPAQFDINLNTASPFARVEVGSVTIIPGRYWSACGTLGSNTWNTDLASGSVPDSCMSVSNPMILAGPSFDPLANGILVGSGAWVCENTGVNTGVPVGTVGTGCSSSNTQSPPPGGTITLKAYTAGAAGTANDYFRSPASLARWIWTGNTGDIGHDFNNIATLAFCLTSQPTPTLGLTTGCGHWQQGIGAPGGLSSITLTSGQIQIVVFFFLVNWTSPFPWSFLTGIGSTTPVLYEPISATASQTLNPASLSGCTAAYPAGGYDC